MKKYSLSVIVMVLILLVKADAVDQWWRVYFTDPGKKNTLQDSNPEKGIIALIDNAGTSFYGAFFDISSAPIVQSLVKAKNRGVDVRIITESDNFDRTGIATLIRSGIPVVIDKKNGLMHDKFAIIDGMIVWTGSFNLTENDARRNNNNAIMICSSDLAEIFLAEFNEMFVDYSFGNKDQFGLFTEFWHTGISINGNDIKAFFSPDDDVESIINDLVRSATISVHFMAFSFTSDTIGDAMVAMHQKGVTITGVMEKVGSSTKYSEYAKMKSAGIGVSLDKNPFLMHHKIIIIDGRIVIIGSFNFTKNANELNDENIIIIENAAIAQCYIQECIKLCAMK